MGPRLGLLCADRGASPRYAEPCATQLPEPGATASDSSIASVPAGDSTGSPVSQSHQPTGARASNRSPVDAARGGWSSPPWDARHNGRGIGVGRLELDAKFVKLPSSTGVWSTDSALPGSKFKTQYGHRVPFCGSLPPPHLRPFPCKWS